MKMTQQLIDDSLIHKYTDSYFNRTKEIVKRYGDVAVTYAIFMRRPVISAPKIMLDWLETVLKHRGQDYTIDLLYPEGSWVGAGDPILYLTGSFENLVDLETLYLQKLGSACVAAWNAYSMCTDLPHVGFMAMDARHCAGPDMADMMAYAAHVGSERAKNKSNAVGFIGSSTNAACHYFGLAEGKGTMPHALIGYAGSTVHAAELFHETYPDAPLTVLVDYFGKEISDSLAVCKRFPDLAKTGQLSIRLDTAGGRFVEGLDPNQSYIVLEKYAPNAIRGYRSEEELRYLIGPGVSAAALWYVREALNKEGFDQVKIVASSGFSPEKCRVMAMAQVPVDMIGTGSYLPDKWNETYATADIIAYDGKPRVKVGREFLFGHKPVQR